MGDELTVGYEFVRRGAARIDAIRWAGFRLTGDDRLDWLQGQATNDVRPLGESKPVSFCLCTPTGQIEAIVDAWPLPDAFFLSCEVAMVPALRRRVDDMVILEDVSLEDARYEMVSVQGPAAEVEARGLIANSNGLAFASNRCGTGGMDIWASDEILARLVDRFPLVSAQVYDVARLEAGVPEWGRDATIRTLPPELGPAFEAAHVSYRKGCYVGQEILMRIFSRGHTNRTWVGLTAEAPLEAGARVEYLTRPDSGVVTSAGFSPARGHIGAASLRAETATVGDCVTVHTAAGPIPAIVRHFPLV